MVGPGHSRQLSQHASNSLVLVNLPEILFQDAALNRSLRLHFEPKVRLWATLAGLARILVVYSTVEEAADRKALLDRSIIEDADTSCENPIPTTSLRVYFGPPTPERMLKSKYASENFLPVPVTDKNFLISPPGSPPVGWQQIKEDPPNTQTLANDLMAALQQLAIDQDDDDLEEPDELQPLGEAGTETVLISSPDDASFPSVLVQDTDGSPQVVNGITIANTPRGVARFPNITQVKATVESMQPMRITPTARPPCEQ